MADDVPEASRIDELLAAVQASLPHRPVPSELDGLRAAGALVVDMRPVEQRSADGALPGAVVVGRNVLEWRLDPTSAFRIPEADSADRVVVLVCDEGYSSSLAAAELQRLGLSRATDLVGGFQAWRRWQASSGEVPTATDAPPPG